MNAILMALFFLVCLAVEAVVSKSKHSFKHDKPKKEITSKEADIPIRQQEKKIEPVVLRKI